jgi:hypothetical protein
VLSEAKDGLGSRLSPRSQKSVAAVAVEANLLEVAEEHIPVDPLVVVAGGGRMEMGSDRPQSVAHP